MTTTLSRTKAKQMTVVYQFAAGACVLGAITLGVLGLPESSTTAELNGVAGTHQPASEQTTSNQNSTESKNPTGSTTAPSVRIDPGSIAERLSMLDNAPKSREVIESSVDTSTDAPAISTVPGAVIKRVRYTGYIRDSEHPMAFIRIDGVQRIIGQGAIAQAGSEGLDDLTIKSVYPTYIIVNDGKNDDRIDLANTSGPAVTMASGAEVVIAEVPQSMEDVVLTPEELAELEKLPSRKRAIREKMIRRERLGIPESKGNTRQPLASFKAGLGDSPRRDPASAAEQD